MKVKIVAISDTHSLHDSLIIPPGDILVHAGDITSEGTINEVKAFNEYLGSLPHPYKIIIAGNHDFCFEDYPQINADLLTNGIYLQDQMITISGIRFYGSPWQPSFYDLAFSSSLTLDIFGKPSGLLRRRSISYSGKTLWNSLASPQYLHTPRLVGPRAVSITQ